MHDYTTNENLKLIAGMVSALVTVGLIAAIAMAFLWMPPPL